MTIPLPAIQHGPDGTFVFTLGPGDTAQQTPVEVGYQDAAIAVVNKGIAAGQAVVLEGQSRLSTGTRVSQAAAPAAPKH